MHVIGTAGHVDHGKSTLVKALTGMDPDRFEEEKQRGLTIDLGFAWFTLPSGREAGVVDVPGHERFIRNMLAGVGGIDAALFVVAADEGWMPQSAEHLAILDFLDVRTGLVALTKAGTVDADTLARTGADVAAKLDGTALEGARVLSVDSVSGEGLDELRTTIDELLAGVAGPADRGRPRLFVDRSFTIAGAGTVVTGTLSGGTLRTDDEIEIMPGGQRARIRTLQTHRRPVEVAVPGSRVAANLVGLERLDITRGDALVRPGAWHSTTEFAARLRASRSIEHPIVERGAYELYIGSAEVPCRIKFLEDPPGAGDVPSLRAGESVLVQVFCMRPTPLDPGDRFIVRDVGRWETIAGGIVLDQSPGRVRRGDPDVLDRLRARENAERGDVIERVIAERRVVRTEDLGRLSGAGPGEVGDALERASAGGRAVTLGEFVLAPAHAAALRDRAMAALDAHHAARHLDPGMPRESLRAALDVEPRLFIALLEAWTDDIVAEGATVRLATHGAQLAPQEQAAAEAALEQLRAGGSSPPEIGELGLDRALVQAMQRRGDIELITPEIAFAADVMRGIEDTLLSLVEQHGSFTVAQVRDAIGTTRKYAVPLLEHLDTTGFTRRQGDVRVLGPKGRARHTT